jgi:hypothetical protein
MYHEFLMPYVKLMSIVNKHLLQLFLNGRTDTRYPITELIRNQN